MDLSVEQKSKTGDGDVSLGQEGGLGRDELNVQVRAWQLLLHIS